MPEQYTNKANSDHPATIIYLVDISGSMDHKMPPDSQKRIDVAKNGIQEAYTQMMARAMRQGVIHPRYRVAMIAYTDESYDVYRDLGTFVTIDALVEQGVPALTSQYKTNMADAFRCATDMLKNDIAGWSEKWRRQCPAPLIVNLTDCEFDEELEDPLTAVHDLRQITVDDGPVLVENIFITEFVQPSVNDPALWPGYRPGETTGDPFGDKMLAMSSTIPSRWIPTLKEQTKLGLEDGCAMLFPGVNHDFIRAGFVMSSVSGAQGDTIHRPTIPESKRPVK